MDIYRAIEELLAEKRRLDEVIARLEDFEKRQLRAADAMPGKRGRRSMSEDERKAVSQRMRKYWAAKRKKEKGCDAAD